MKAALVMMIVLLSFASFLQAQDAANSNTTIQGCLQYNHRHYVLMDTAGKSHQLSGSLSKLKPHIGHEVELTGTEAVHTTGTTQDGAASSAHMTPVFQVSSIKHIADTCTAGSQAPPK